MEVDHVELEALSAREIYKLYQQSLTNSRLSMLTPVSFEEFIDNKAPWEKEFIIRWYEQRPEVWDEFKITILRQLVDELVEDKVFLYEHPQGFLTTKSGRKRKRPSLWSHKQNKKPTTVEFATAELFKDQGYEVSFWFGDFEYILLAAYLIIAGVKTYRLSMRENPSLLQRINQVSAEQLESVLDDPIKECLGDHVKLNTDPTNKLLNQEKLQKLLSMDQKAREQLLESEFCNGVVIGSKNRTELKSKLIEAHKAIPQSFLGEFFKNTAIYGRQSGCPDLFMWREGECKFVEVKSPNDKVHHNQAMFYNYNLKPMQESFRVAKVVPYQEF